MIKKRKKKKKAPKSKAKGSIYTLISKTAEREYLKSVARDHIDIQGVVRRMREERNLSGVEMCRRAGADLDPKTLTALEKGRIRNPSIKTLQAIARGLSVNVSDVFRAAESNLERHLYQGSQKGFYRMEFTSMGLKLVSFTPFVKEFFSGKIIFGARKKMDATLLKHPLPIFVQTLVGRFDITVEDVKISMREGENLFFNGILKHSFSNPLERESSLLIMTSPSFL